jgi:Tol biopolymer transport system component
MKRLLLLVTVLAFAGAAPGTGVRSAATAADRAASGAEGVVVFASNRDGDADLYAVNTDGTGITHLTNDPNDEYSPLPSPDGKHILFEGGDDGHQVMDVDGGGRRSLPDCSISPGAWSPDSRHLVCSEYEVGIIIVDTVDGSFKPLTDSGTTPVWSPDGTTIAFIDEHKVYAMPAAGGTRMRLGIRKANEFAAPTWSPDSQRIAYVSIVTESHYALWTIRADGSNGRRVAQNVAEITPSWSPDGSHIAFIKYTPHYNTTVFAARTDGSGVHEISGNSRTGEYAGSPSWSGDGQLVLYNRGRFRGSDDSDVWAASPTGRGRRALTHPFPTGGSSGGPQWLPAPRVSGAEDLPPTVAVPFSRKLTVPQSVVWMATDGTRAVPKVSAEKQPRLTVWDAATGHVQRGPIPCDSTYGPGYLAIARQRLAWTCSEAGNTYYSVGLLTARLGARRGHGVASVSGDEEGGDNIVGLIGHGDTIVFSNHHGGEQGPSDPWLVLTHKAKQCPESDLGYDARAVCRPLGTGRGVTTAVDRGRVVAVTTTGVVRIISRQGRVLRSWSLAAGVVAARLRGRTLAVQHAVTVDTYDVQSGAKRQSRELGTDGGPPPFLLGVQGDLVVYETGGAIHVMRLSNGRDKALRLPGAAPELDASFEPAGLFLSWNKMHDRRPGRLGFIPLRVLNARL